jgi:uncharacterized membrane protein
MENVLAIYFEGDSKAYEALTKLKELDQQGQLGLAAGAVVVRSEDGHLDTKDEVGGMPLEGTATGGVLGLLIGILGGPLGVLIGGTYGVLVGSLFDLADSDETESALSDISRSVRPGNPALIAQATEQSPEVVDSAMSALGGTVLRRPVDEVMAEIAAAEDAQRAAEKEARTRLREQRQAQTKADIQAKLDDLKAKLHGHPAAARGS